MGFATIRTGPIQLYFMLPDILENTPDVRLTNFESVKYADSECEIKENQDKDSLPTGYNGTVTLNLSGSTKVYFYFSDLLIIFNFILYNIIFNFSLVNGSLIRQNFQKRRISSFNPLIVWLIIFELA